MTIKKIKPASSAALAAPTPAAAPAAGGATIADRFKLDAPVAAKTSGGTVGKKMAAIALVVGLVALTVVGVLAFVLYQHWDYLCNQVA